MSKIPEQLAEELADQWAKRDTNHWRDIKGAFITGYQAGVEAEQREQLAKEKEIQEMMRQDMQKTMDDIVEVILFPKSKLHDEHFFKPSPWSDMIERSKKDK